MVQRAANTREFASDPAQVHAAARAGLRAALTALPYGGGIQRAFGHHPVDGVRAAASAPHLRRRPARPNPH
jgi:hypothetical protein